MGRDSNFELVIVNQSLDAWNQRRIPAIDDRFECRNSDLGVVAKVMQGTAFHRLATKAGEKSDRYGLSITAPCQRAIP
jgi:hypothetical protein